jgi:hypothetical protein
MVRVSTCYVKDLVFMSAAVTNMKYNKSLNITTASFLQTGVEAITESFVCTKYAADKG